MFLESCFYGVVKGNNKDEEKWSWLINTYWHTWCITDSVSFLYSILHLITKWRIRDYILKTDPKSDIWQRKRQIWVVLIFLKGTNYLTVIADWWVDCFCVLPLLCTQQFCYCCNRFLDLSNSLTLAPLMPWWKHHLEFWNSAHKYQHLTKWEQRPIPSKSLVWGKSLDVCVLLFWCW